MNPSSLLIGTTGLLLVVALLLSISGMNKKTDPDEREALKQELAELEKSRKELESSSNKPYLSPNFPLNIPPAAPAVTESDEAAKLREQLEALQRENERLRQPAPEPVVEAEPVIEPEPIMEDEPVAEVATTGGDPAARARLIEKAILQATVSGADPENGFVVLDPAPSANFSVGQELGIRRNNGILCRLHVDSSANGQYIATIMAAFGSQADVQAGDEVIIPPAFDGVLD